jgi:hypothetical protein
LFAAEALGKAVMKPAQHLTALAIAAALSSAGLVQATPRMAPPPDTRAELAPAAHGGYLVSAAAADPSRAAAAYTPEPHAERSVHAARSAYGVGVSGAPAAPGSAARASDGPQPTAPLVLGLGLIALWLVRSTRPSQVR